MTVQETLDRLGLYWKREPGFVPVKDKATVRLNVSIGGGGVELLATGPKWYDTRKEQGGGAIDLTMHLFRLSFVGSSQKTESMVTPVFATPILTTSWLA
ncbi:hypothetical protein [Klebsiella quasipneumoniae]|uniref:hypothetical protein n=1 Tax=Klebsiella quasipneumoniae TaxID=1463165 RepID=UPI001602D156|nr:hypothetical protein [Klebsiella quasipneumoniae]